MNSPFSKLSKFFEFDSTPKEESVIGIDFGSSSIKLVQLKQDRDTAVLETYGELQLGPYAGVEVGRATNLESGKITQALVDIIQEASVTSRSAGIAVPYASSFVTVVSLPTQDNKTLQAMIPIEARKYVPVPIAQVTLDWFVIPEKKGSAGADTASKATRVLLAAIHNEALGKFKSVAEGSGITSSFNEIEIFSTIRSSVERPEDTVMLIDIGAATTKLYIVSGGIVQVTHSMTVGGQDLTLALAKSLELKVDEAEELKRQVGLTEKNNPRIERALSFPLERICLDSRRMLEGYERLAGVPPVSSIILSGGGSTLRGFEEYAHGILGRTVVPANPFSKLGYPAFLADTLREIGPSFAVAIGVALRKLGER